MPFLNTLSFSRKKKIEDYFSNAPYWVLDAVQVLEMEKNVEFVKENSPADMIYFLAKGTVKAVEYRIYGITYDFNSFGDVYAFGGMEVVMGEAVYRTTLQTVTPCTIARLPRAIYEKWLFSDINALSLESKSIAEYLLDQGRRSRVYLFLQGADRLAYTLMETYQREQKKGVLYVKSTRQELADVSGLCVKTVNRAIKKFEEDGFITRHGNHFTINQRQYQAIDAAISELIEK